MFVSMCLCSCVYSHKSHNVGISRITYLVNVQQCWGFFELLYVYYTLSCVYSKQLTGLYMNITGCLFVCWLVACLTSQQHASVSQGRICSDNFTCCHTETEVADQMFYLTRSQYTDTGLTSPSADPVTPGAWQGSHWSANF